MILLCAELNKRFIETIPKTRKFKGDATYRFLLQDVKGGGIVQSCYPGKRIGCYASMLFGCDTFDGKYNADGNWLYPDKLRVWRESEKIVFQKGKTYNMTCQTWNGRAPWEDSELDEMFAKIWM